MFQRCWCPGLVAGLREAGETSRQMPLVYWNTQPEAALGELLASFSLPAAPGASLSLLPFAPLCETLEVFQKLADMALGAMVSWPRWCYTEGQTQ